MLLSGGEPLIQEWLQVQNQSKARVHRQRLPMQRIFRVKLSAFQGRPDTSYFWLRLEGPKENLSKAKVKRFSPPRPLPARSLCLCPCSWQGSPVCPHPHPHLDLQCGVQVRIPF